MGGRQQVVITGGAGALARAIAVAFEDGLYDLATPGREDLDVTAGDAVDAWFDGRPPLDLLVCNAGQVCDVPLTRMTECDWDEVLGVNLDGALRCARAAARQMLDQQRGHVIFISSYSALHPPVGQAAYATAKAALLGLTRGLAQEWGAHGIRVNAVLPGFMDTPMTQGVSEQRREAVRGSHALGRFNTVESAARFIRTLHEDLPHTSGQIFQLDSR